MARKGLFGMKKGLFGYKSPMGPMFKMKWMKKRTNGIMSRVSMKRSFRAPWSFKRWMGRPIYYSEPMKFLRILPRRVFAR